MVDEGFAGDGPVGSRLVAGKVGDRPVSDKFVVSGGFTGAGAAGHSSGDWFGF